jgi:hypothetical protein
MQHFRDIRFHARALSCSQYYGSYSHKNDSVLCIPPRRRVKV